MAKRPTLDHYKRVLQLRRARVPSDVITMITGLPLDVVQGLLERGLPAKKGKHPPQRPIRAVLVEDQAEQTTQAIEWAGEISSAARETARERAKTARTAAVLERVLIQAWKSKVDTAIKDAKAANERVTISDLLPPADLFTALRTLRWSRDLGPDARAPFDVYRGRLAEGEESEQDEPEIDPTIYRDLLELDEAELLDFATTGEKRRPVQLELKAGGSE